MDKSNSSQQPSKWKMSRRNFAAASAALASGLVTQSRPGHAGAWFGDWLRGLDNSLPGGSGGSGGSGNGGGGNGGNGGGSNSGGGHCFLRGTRILTPTGEVAVEQLKAGDLVTTQSGIAKQILGVVVQSRARLDGKSWPASALPVRIVRGALEPETPRKDLYLSQTHMVFIDGILVPAGYFVNGETIRIVEPEGVDQLDYYHIELDGHDVVFAEGAACETFVAAYTKTYAPITYLGGVRTRVGSRLRSAVSPIVDIRNRADVVRDRREDRAELLRAA
ncbi:MAG: Hint domain-containing protein [Hyphomicrobiaceae bacterium]